MSIDFSDRVWSTLLWEFMRYTKKALSNSAYVDQVLGDTQEIGFLKEPEFIRILSRDALNRIVHVFAPGLFLEFLRANTELLSPDGVIEWTRKRQEDYPEDDLRRTLGGQNKP